MNNASDLTLFWAIDGGVELIKLMHEYGADLDARTPKDWTPLSYCKAKGKYGATEEKGIYPEVRPFICSIDELHDSGIITMCPFSRLLSCVQHCQMSHRYNMKIQLFDQEQLAAEPIAQCFLIATFYQAYNHAVKIIAVLTVLLFVPVQDVLLYYGASEYGSGPPVLGQRSPRNSFNPEAENFMRERGSYQAEPEHP